MLGAVRRVLLASLAAGWLTASSLAAQDAPYLLTEPGGCGFASFSSDGKTLVTSDGWSSQVWDYPSLELRSVSPGRFGLSVPGQLSRDASYAWGRGSQRDLILLWDLATQRPVRELSAREALGFSPTAPVIAVAVDGGIELYRVATGERIGGLWPTQVMVCSGAFSPSGEEFVSVGKDCTVRVWDVAREEPLAETEIDSFRAVRVGFTPDGDGVVVWLPHEELVFRDLRTLEPVRVYRPSCPVVSDFDFSPDGTMIAFSSIRRRVYVEDFEAGSLSHVVDFESGRVLTPDEVRELDRKLAEGPPETRGGGVRTRPYAYGVRYTPGGDGVLISGGLLSDGQGIRSICAPWGGWTSPTQIALSGNGERLALTTQDNRIGVWDLSDGRLGRVIRPQWEWIASLTVSGDGGRLAARGSDHKTCVWDLGTGRLLTDQLPFCNTLALDERGEKIALGYGSHRSLEIWDVATVSKLHSLDEKAGVGPGISFTPSGDGVFYTRGRSTGLWRPGGPADQRLRVQGRDPLPLGDGSQIACLARPRIYHYDLASGEQLAEVRPPRDDAPAEGGDPDEAVYYAWHSYSDADVLVFGARTGRLLLRLPSPRSYPYEWAFDTRGARFIVTDNSCNVRVHSLADGRLLATLVLPSGEGFADDDWLIVTPQGYYDGTPAAANFAQWCYMGGLYPVSLMADFHRPDIVRETLNGEGLPPDLAPLTGAQLVAAAEAD